MGWFSSIVDAVASVIPESVVRAAKTVAAKAIDFMAEKAEKIVGKVKEVWRRVKPYVQMAQEPLRRIAKATAAIPVVGAVTSAAAVGVDALLALENSPVLKKFEKHISIAAQKARELRQQIKEGKIAWLTPEEYEAAIKTRKDLRAAEKEIRTAEAEAGTVLAEKDLRKIELATAINDFGIAKTDVKNAIEGEPTDFEHYLRLRATQKLLGMAETKLMAAGSVDGLTEDDWFLVHIASDLIKANPELKTTAAKRLNTILKESYGKTLQSFVYEELVAAWKKQAQALEEEHNKSTDILAKNKVALRRLQVAMRVQEQLDEKEAKELTALESTVPVQENELDALATRHRDIERYANAAEGFLQLLEKTPEQLEEEDRGYVLEEGERVGQIIVEAAENETPFNSLSADAQALITDFSNIFRKEATKRMDSVLEVAA